MRVTEVLILAVQLAVVSGRLTVLTGKEDADRKNRNSRELVCVSDDDGAGLTWNSNLNWKQSSHEFFDREVVTSFQNPNQPRRRGLLDCELNQNGKCTSSWSTEGWSLTSSIETPMGPVLDRRWEALKEKWDQHVSPFSKQSMQSFVVSIRGTASGEIKICKMTDFLIEMCYWIRIGNWENTWSYIGIYVESVPRDEMVLDNTTRKQQTYDRHTALSPFEWKTFVVTWNESTRNISVYDSERMILTLVDSEERLSKQNTYHYLHLGGNTTTLFRLHNYNFLHTTDPDAVLASPELSVTTTNFCVEMAVGLCAECQLELTLANLSTDKVGETLEVIKGYPTVHGLPAWRYVRVNKSISLGNSKVKLRMVTVLRHSHASGVSPNPLWAVANVRSCPLADSIRKGRMKTTIDHHEYYWPNVTCQKLFYNENTVVNSWPPATLNMEFADSDCQLGKLGPHCSISCTEDLQLEEDCKNAKICEESGCTCSPGYTGPRCDERCVPKQSTMDWLLSIIVQWVLPITLILILAVAAFYLHQRKRIKRQADNEPRELLPCIASPKNTLPGDCWLRVSPDVRRV